MAHLCENCKFRAHYDKKPNSMLGKFFDERSGKPITVSISTSPAMRYSNAICCPPNTTQMMFP